MSYIRRQIRVIKPRVLQAAKGFSFFPVFILFTNCLESLGHGGMLSSQTETLIVSINYCWMPHNKALATSVCPFFKPFLFLKKSFILWWLDFNYLFLNKYIPFLWVIVFSVNKDAEALFILKLEEKCIQVMTLVNLELSQIFGNLVHYLYLSWKCLNL